MKFSYTFTQMWYCELTNMIFIFKKLILMFYPVYNPLSTASFFVKWCFGLFFIDQHWWKNQQFTSLHCHWSVCKAMIMYFSFYRNVFFYLRSVLENRSFIGFMWFHRYMKLYAQSSWLWKLILCTERSMSRLVNKMMSRTDPLINIRMTNYQLCISQYREVA